MRELSEKYQTFFWVSVIVAAELTAFALLQKSVDSSKNATFYILSAMFLFGVVVSLAFRETLFGNKIAIANLYWIVASTIGSAILGYWVFKQNLEKKDIAAIVILLIAIYVQLYGGKFFT